MLKHALRRYLVKSWLGGGGRLRPPNQRGANPGSRRLAQDGGADEGPALAFETIERTRAG
jgi:hypothetical protein